MCNTCGCNITPGNRHLARRTQPAGTTAVEVLQRLLSGNDACAAGNRTRFDATGLLVINLMSSPGSGKTSLLEATIDALADRVRIGVIEGDLETENDARRIRAHGVPAEQITTGSACHLDAHMVAGVLDHLPLSSLDILFVENVGNLVCPAGFDLGQHCDVVLLSVTEGDDKPAKYPVMFRAADLVVLSKADLLPVLGDFDPGRARQQVRELANAAPVIEVSARQQDGLRAWTDWLLGRLQQHRADAGTQRAASAPALRYRPVGLGQPA
ncbi:MAG: hydrogenase nickel incorporation protein HypB [Betaproteobacteria bacterium]|nr:hydrogenase nickel incorporation protein HypB [Betaproteobacteria bacterium]